MKRNVLFSAALAGLMLASCASKDDLGGAGTVSNDNAGGYIALSLNLPTSSSTMSRAENDKFDDGTANEYEVKDGTLILFEGKDESSATFAAAYTLKNLSMNSTTTANDNITTTTTITQKLNNGLNDEVNNKFYAIVVLNNNGTLAVNETDASLKVNNEDFGKKKTIADLYGLECTPTTDAWKTTGFLMMNAPLSTNKGGTTGATVVTAAEIDKNHIYDTEAKAKNNTSANVYVERALAKVQVTAETDKQKGTLTDAPKASYEITGWMLDNTNKKSYYLRNTSNASSWLSLCSNSTSLTDANKKYRFVGSNAMEEGVSLYRTYWATDPNYGDVADFSANFITIGGSTPASTALKNLSDVDYCLENTFDVAHQNQNVTTRVIVAAKLKTETATSYTTFYIVNDNENNLLDETGMKKAVKAAFLNNTDVQKWITKGLSDGSATIGDGDLEVSNINKVGYNKPTITFTDSGKAKYSSSTPPTITDEIQAIIDAIKVATYENGVSYYPVRIKHFGDDLTPWREKETPTPTVASGAYPSTNGDANYLGRYGVLRNNWYDVQVTGIKKLGFPVVPEVTNDTDDEMAAYISVKINVLSWAKRTQSALLGE